ncbi:acyl transferase/acyl hydrolase/lysophospholipase [Staphylotrichum tortipilum]|uniref:Lysophospholipase n=1 Tax=Staphylotrichum tortipilum TaxID=2831512 RepID=A0AAN6MSI5_9PEZI|nr:acyl transferase/acyl hydrolase/lysophospholipase [Staphylotrichum longicolle]
MRLHPTSTSRLSRPRLPLSVQGHSPRPAGLALVTQACRPRVAHNNGLGLGLGPSHLQRLRQAPRRCLFLPSPRRHRAKVHASKLVSVMLTTALLAFWLFPYPTDALQLPDPRARKLARGSGTAALDADAGDDPNAEQTAWARFSRNFAALSFVPSIDKLPEKAVDLILPEWVKLVPGYVRKLQREMNTAPGSLAAEIWQEAQDPYTHPEIGYSAKVRVSGDLCDEEKTFLARRRKMIMPALARFLGIDEKEIHPDDVPTIAMCGSGGGLRALVAGTGSFQATAEDGLFDCTTYVSGVSGSCWLQSLYFSSVTGNNFQHAIDHLKVRLGTHIAYPPVAFTSLTSSPTNKYLLSGLVEKLKGDPRTQFGLVDIYGMLLAARLLIPKGELGVNEKDFKLSNQREYMRYGQNPLPIYTAVRHEIPELDSPDYEGEGSISEEAKSRAKKEAWFQWFEITPYEFFCEEFSAGIPTWAMGRKFKNGSDLPSASGYRLPETRLPFLLGIWGSAFCATLSHYYREIRPVVKSLTGFQSLDELIWGHNKDLSKVHPIEPASMPNFVHGMYGKLPNTVPQAVYDNEYIQLMDAGMSNNLPIYPLLRPGREVDIVITFDASADIKTDNWLSVVEGYARQRNIKGWPVGAGWPQPTEPPSMAAAELEEAQARTPREAEAKIAEAKTAQQAARHPEPTTTTDTTPAPKPIGEQPMKPESQRQTAAASELGYCTVWVGTTAERSGPPPPPPLTTAPPQGTSNNSTWDEAFSPTAGIALIYLPFLANPAAAPGVDVATADYLSTWNFVYTPAQVDAVVALARANYAEGREQVRATVRAVYERKRRRRVEREEREEREEWRRGVRRGVVGGLGAGDHFTP